MGETSKGVTICRGTLGWFDIRKKVIRWDSHPEEVFKVRSADSKGIIAGFHYTAEKDQQ